MNEKRLACHNCGQDELFDATVEFVYRIRMRRDPAGQWQEEERDFWSDQVTRVECLKCGYVQEPEFVERFDNEVFGG